MYDLCIIGMGSAGFPSGIYASRYGLKNAIIGSIPGGALASSHRVENWPGIEAASGREIMTDFQKHAQNVGSELVFDYVHDVYKQDDHFVLQTSMGKTFESKYVLISTGSKYRKLGVEGEDLVWISYCATCDGMFSKNKEVAIVGGGDTAITEALYLAEICSKVHILHRRDEFRAEPIWIEKLADHDNIEIHFNTQVQKVLGEKEVSGVQLQDGSELALHSLFVAVGHNPNTDGLENLNLAYDEQGCIEVDVRQETSVKGVYAAGDVTNASNKFKQTIMSAAEGALAANSIHEDNMRS